MTEPLTETWMPGSNGGLGFCEEEIKQGRPPFLPSHFPSFLPLPSHPFSLSLSFPIP